MRNHLAAQSVTRNSQRQVIWRRMRESTLMRNHLAAQSVARHSSSQVIWRDMKESILVRNRLLGLVLFDDLIYYYCFWMYDLRNYTTNRQVRVSIASLRPPSSRMDGDPEPNPKPGNFPSVYGLLVLYIISIMSSRSRSKRRRPVGANFYKTFSQSCAIPQKTTPGDWYEGHWRQSTPNCQIRKKNRVPLPSTKRAAAARRQHGIKQTWWSGWAAREHHQAFIKFGSL